MGVPSTRRLNAALVEADDGQPTAPRWVELPLRHGGAGAPLATDGVHVDRDPRVLLAGYGSGASTIGATRAGRAAALAAVARSRR